MTDKSEQVPEHHRQWFETLQLAFKHGNVALMRGTLKATNEPVTILCMVSQHQGTYTFTPCAQFPEGDPFETFEPAAIDERQLQ